MDWEVVLDGLYVRVLQGSICLFIIYIIESFQAWCMYRALCPLSATPTER